MNGLTVRPATPGDAAAITAVHCSHVQVWRRGGKGEVVPYDVLSPYEHWLHGGPWMNVETCAAYLRGWLGAGHLALVALQGDKVVGEAEFVEDEEPPPYGHVLHLSLLFVHAAHQGQGVGRTLVEAGVELARERGCAALTTQPEREAEPFYHRVGFEPWLWLREWQGRQTTDDRRQTTDHRPRTTDDRPRTTDHGRRTTDHGRQTTDHRRQTTDRRRLAIRD
jgi:GNAT superfamily N-acetyltransferase